MTKLTLLNNEKQNDCVFESNGMHVKSSLIKQAEYIKRRYNNPVVWFECDDFYEAVGVDAIITDLVLNNGLTQRPDNGIIISGFDANMIDEYLHKMVLDGNRVAIVTLLSSKYRL